MALKVLTLLALLTSSLSHVIAIHQQCIDTLCNIASGCDTRQENCLGTGNAYCGPFRLSHRFWRDAGSPGSTFKSCIFDYTCSVETINLYMSKYGRDCNSDGQVDCDDFAAIHLAGGESSCSQKWLFSSNRYKKYLRLMSLASSSRTQGVNVYEVIPRVSSAGPSYDKVEKDTHDNESGAVEGDDGEDNITYVPSSSSFNVSTHSHSHSAALRDSRRINSNRRRSTRVPSSGRRYTVIYWNGNRRRLPEITNILDNNPWIIESARRTSSNDVPVNSNPPISRRTYFNPTTPLTSTTTTTTTTTSAPSVVTRVTSTGTTDAYIPVVTVTRRRRVRPRTNRRPLVVNTAPGRRPSGRRQPQPQPSSPPVETTVTMSTTASTDDSSFSPLSTPAPVTTVLTRVPTRRVTTTTSAPVTERPVRSTTPQAWWMSATRRRFPTYNWIDSDTTRPVNPWALYPSTTPPVTRRTASRTTSTTPMTTVYIAPTTAAPTTVRTAPPSSAATPPPTTTTLRTTTERPTTIPRAPPTTISRAPPTTISRAPPTTTTRVSTTVTSTTPATTFFTSEITTTSGSRHVTFGPHRTRTSTESPETTVDAAAGVTPSKKPKGIFNDSSVTVNELKDSCMECICTGSSETCNFDAKFRCDKEDECGPYQIDYAYWYEAGYPNFKGNGDVDFHECATDRECAEKTVRTYLEKNKVDCNADGMIDCIDYAAIHKAGPDSCHKQFVYESKYWTSFSQCHGFDIFKRR